MPRSFFHGFIFGTLAAMSASSCANATTPIATAPTPVAINEPAFVDTLTVNGAKTQVFTTTGGGLVTITLATLDAAADASPTTVGLSLGVWSGNSCQTQPTLSLDTAVLGTSLTGSAAGAGSLCVRIYDVGKLTGPVGFTINIVHF